MSGFYVGMSGPGAAIAHEVPNPVNRATGATVPIMSAVSKTLTVTYRFRDGSALVVTSWTFAALTADSVRALYIPSAGDFPAEGQMTVETQLVLDGVTYQFTDERDVVADRPRR